LVALQYVLLPVLAQIFNLNYAQVGFLRGVSHTAMSCLEIPAGVLAEKWGEQRLLIFGLVCAGIGYIGVAFSTGFLFVACALAIAGTGAAFQHSLASSLIAKSFNDAQRRRALGTYNSTGDAGKLLFAGVFSLGMGAGIAWSHILLGLALISIAFSVVVWLVLRSVRGDKKSVADTPHIKSGIKSWGIKNARQFRSLGFIVFLDSLVQAVFLTFLAFVVLDKGASETVASASVVIALVGGMIGKFVSGFLAAKFGDRNTFRILQLLTAVGVASLIVLPLEAILFVLPVIGLAVQGTSTVTYGSVSEFVDKDRQSRGYALIYSLSGISSVIGPMSLGLLADAMSLNVSIGVLSIIALMPLPLSHVLRKKIS
jgi:FSR family fosmidomycin resistance protein-like MFS transporter